MQPQELIVLYSAKEWRCNVIQKRDLGMKAWIRLDGFDFGVDWVFNIGLKA
jgi:hypothetical protein